MAGRSVTGLFSQAVGAGAGAGFVVVAVSVNRDKYSQRKKKKKNTPLRARDAPVTSPHPLLLILICDGGLVW